MQFAYPLTAIGTLLIAILQIVFSFRVGSGRQKLEVPAPSMSGPDEWNRAVRVHANTVEQWVIFLPVLWIFAVVVGDLQAGIAALLWFASRVLYSIGYIDAPGKRAPGFLIGFLTMVVMILWSLGMLLWGLFSA